MEYQQKKKVGSNKNIANQQIQSVYEYLLEVLNNRVVLKIVQFVI